MTANGTVSRAVSCLNREAPTMYLSSIERLAVWLAIAALFALQLAVMADLYTRDPDTGTTKIEQIQEGGR